MIMLHLFADNYALLLLKELGLEQNRTSINQTYIQVNKTNNQEKQFDLSEVEHC